MHKNWITGGLVLALTFAMQACGGGATDPKPTEEKVDRAGSELVAYDVAVEEGGGCNSYCDDRYCYICRARAEDGRCFCIIAD
jgi:hypothetical protein